MSNDLVSIIVPVYNKEQKIQMCLESITNQTYSNVEIILIDDGSNDKSGEICDLFAQKDARITVKHISNGGVGFARNIGVGMAAGRYVQFVDADDYLDVDMVERLHAGIVAHDASMSVCGYKQIVRGEIVGDIHPDTDICSDINEYMNMIEIYRLDPLCGSPCNRMIKRQLIIDNNIKFNQSATFAEDFMFVFDCVQKCERIVFIASSYYNYIIDVQDSLSKVTKLKIENAWEQELYFCTYLYNQLVKNNLFALHPTIISEVYFSLLSSSTVSRIKARYKTRAIVDWIIESINPPFPFSIHDVSCENRRSQNDANSKKRAAGIIFEKGLKTSILTRFIMLYVSFAKIVLPE